MASKEVVVNEEVVKQRKLPKISTLKETDLSKNEVVKQPMGRIDNGMLPSYKKSNAGRKRKYTPTRMKNSINKYFDWCEKNDRVPSIKGLMIFLKMHRDLFYRYMAYPEYTAIMEHARLIIAEWCENDVYRTKGQAAGKIAYMKNVHDWTEKIDSNATVAQVITPEQARAKIEMLAPKLLEMLKNANVLDQITQKEGVQQAQETILEAVQIPNLGLVEENNPRRL